MMQVPFSPSNTQARFSTQVHKRDRNPRKATLRVAFRFSPVLLAFLLSSLCISFLFNIHPARANLENALDESTSRSTSLEHASLTTSSRNETRIKISPVFTKEIFFWEEKILSWADTFQLDPNLVALVMQIESCGHPDVQSQSGANGLFQVMPFHFSPDEDPFNPDTNASRGLTYLSRSLALAENDSLLALAGYNGGHSVIQRDPGFWAEETRRYVYWGSGILSDISKGLPQSSRLQEWLMAGGKNLCRRAALALGL